MTVDALRSQFGDDFPAQDFAPVDEYARGRLSDRGDVYGWLPMVEEGRGSRAILLVNADADVASFPDRIGAVRIEVRPIPPPQEHEEAV